MVALTLLLLALFAPARQEPPLVPEAADDYVAARAGEIELRWKELDELLLLRHGMSQAGREALRHLSETRVVEAAAKELGVAVSAAALDARVGEIEKKVMASGGQTLEQHLQGARLTQAEFRYFLRVSMQQEELTRRALGLKPDAEVSPDQARLWIQEALTDREWAALPPPWTDGVVVHATGFSISVQDYVRYLRRRLTPDELRQDCYQFLLCRRVRARLPDVAQSKVDEYVQKEIERRRRESALDPKNKGLSFEKLLAAQGLSLDALARDPGVIASALSKLWIDRAYDAETLKRSYQNERAYYDDRFGEAIDVSRYFVPAAQFPNQFIKRTFSEAEAELRRLAGGLKSLEEFQKAAKANPEDAAARESGGALGWVSAAGPSAPAEVRAEVKKRLALVPTPAQLAGEGLVGPVRTPTGCVLLWLGPRRAAPTWDVMAGYVQRELRTRFFEEALPRDSVTYNLGN
jgi:transcriptional regulator with XRE-family HTH domain